jgi:hypothetical protein
MSISGLIWAVVVVLAVLWLFGLIAHIGGGLIHLLLVVAVIALVANLIMRTRARHY